MADPLQPSSEVPSLAPRAPEMHKGQAGRVAIVAGHLGMTGAAVLAGRGALRGGAGLVRIYCPASALPIIAAAEPCVMTVALAERSGEAADSPASGGGGAAGLAAQRAAEQVRTPWADVIAIGPGLGLTSDVVEFVRLLLDLPTPVVLDADGLNALALLDGDAGGPSQLAAGVGSRTLPRVITPHPGEFARLCDAAGLAPHGGDDVEARLAAARAYALHSGAIVVLKGSQTVVCSRDQAFVNSTGNPGMATGGMGDVLTGLLAALIGQGVAPFDAACLAVWVHGRAGDLASRSIGPIGLTASDVVACLPAALAERLSSPVGFRGHDR